MVASSPKEFTKKGLPEKLTGLDLDMQLDISGDAKDYF